ncbi:MAG: beta-glucosidase BglX [Bacteroidales bacterium]|nr:beta-glucosidase BglX [Bacteroidales bacterium]
MGYNTGKLGFRGLSAALSMALAMGAAAEECQEFVDNLLSQMTIDEKIGQLTLPAAGDISTGTSRKTFVDQQVADGKIGGILNIRGAEKIRSIQEVAVEKSRLHIPLLIGMDVIHGYRTGFPIPLAQSCTWDIPAIEEAAAIAAKEASACGISWTFSPMVDISRDPRWGRQAEGAGEDPYLGSEVARAMVRGFQGDLSKDTQVLACLKHFALYGAAEAGRDYNTVDMSRQQMYNVYFPPYKAAVEEGVGSVMSSFNIVDGLHATANPWLLTEVLRNQWSFDGFVVTDYASINEMSTHGLGSDYDNSIAALKAGTDMDMISEGFARNLKKGVENGDIPEALIDSAVSRILTAKYRLGLFQNPYKYNNTEREKTDLYLPEARKAAKDMAAKSFVLLKNENSLLPLKAEGKILLTGPLADSGANLPGTWAGDVLLDQTKSVLESMREYVGNKCEILYAKGSNICDDPHVEWGMTVGGREMRDSRSAQEMLNEALEKAQSADVIVACLGEGGEGSGEGSSRADLTLPDAQQRLLEALVATGKPIVLLNFSGRATVLSHEDEVLPAIMNVWFGGSEAADAITEVVFGDICPSGKLTVSMPRSVGQIPVYYNHLMTGRPKIPYDAPYRPYSSNYLDIPNSPLYPFGYGLSYTNFDYSDFEISDTELKDNGVITASINVKNTGNRDADEIVQLYIRDVIRSIAPPVMELKGFQRLSLKAGESRRVSFDITPEMLKFYNYDLEFVAEPGQFDIMIGGSSDKTLKQSFEYKQ